jgi:Protein kinase domain
VTDQPLATGLRAPGETRAPSTPNGHEAGAVIALEPSEPTRAARRRLRLAAADRAVIDHPNLIRAWPVGDGDGRLFIAFEQCPYPSLTERLAAAPLKPTECAHILDGAVAGVDALSQRALVARDLTPERVFVHPEHGGVLMDLGIPPDLLRRLPLEQDPARRFRSPEELQRSAVDLRSSVYSLGAIFFTALTGVPPDDYSAHIAEASHRPSDRRSELSPGIDGVVARALAKAPAERYPSPEALSRAAAAAVGADLALKILGRGLEPNARRQQRLPKRPAASPQRNGGRPTTAPRTNDGPMPPRQQTHPQPGPTEIPPLPPHVEPPSESRPAHRVAGHFPAAVRRCVALMATLLAEAGTAARRAHRALIRLKRSAPSVAQYPGRRIGRFARDGWKLGSRLVGSGAVAVRRAFGPRGRTRRAAATRGVPQHSSTHRRLLLPAIGAIVASALSGIALGRAFEPERGPASVSRSGLTVQLPHGWEAAEPDPVLPTVSPAIAAVPSGQTDAGFIAGKLSSLAAAERMLARSRERATDGLRCGWARLTHGSTRDCDRGRTW